MTGEINREERVRKMKMSTESKFKAEEERALKMLGEKNKVLIIEWMPNQFNNWLTKTNTMIQ